MMNKDEDGIEGRICRMGFKMLQLSGLHPQQKSTVSLALTPVILLAPVACVVIAYQQLIFGNRDVDSFVKNSEACGVFTQILVVVLVCRFNPTRWQLLLDGEKQFWGLSRLTGKHYADVKNRFEHFFETAEKACKVSVFSASLLVAILLYAGLFLGHLPYGTQNFKSVSLRRFYLGLQMICLGHAVCYSMGMMVMIFSGTIINLIMQYKMVNMALNDLEGMKDGRQLERGFAKIVQHHAFLRRHTKALNDIYSPILAFTFLTGGVMLYAQVYSVFQKGHDVYLVKLVLTYTVTLFVYAFFSFLSQTLLDAELSLGDACYSTSWYDIDRLDIRRYIVLLIARAQKPVVIEAWGLFEINNTYIVALLKVSWSLMNIMKAIGKK